MKISPVLHQYYINTQNNKKNTPFKRDITTATDVQNIRTSRLTEKQKNVVIDAYERTRDFLDELDADINLQYSPEKKEKSLLPFCKQIFPERLGFQIEAKNLNLDNIPMFFDIMEDVEKGVDADTLADIIKFQVRDYVKHIKSSITYRPSGDDDFYQDNTGKWDLTDAYIP